MRHNRERQWGAGVVLGKSKHIRKNNAVCGLHFVANETIFHRYRCNVSDCIENE